MADARPLAAAEWVADAGAGGEWLSDADAAQSSRSAPERQAPLLGLLGAVLAGLLGVVLVCSCAWLLLLRPDLLRNDHLHLGPDGSEATVESAAARGGRTLWANVCAKGDRSAANGHEFCDQSLPIDVRAADFVARLDDEEKQSLLVNSAGGVERLGVPPYQWWNEGLHGAMEPCFYDEGAGRWRCPTSFPAPVGLAASLNDSLFAAVGGVIGAEGRAISNLRRHNGEEFDGLTYWAPNVNMHRDPRWGRNQEAPGEDPLLTSRYAANFVRGMQEGPDEDRVQMAACCKHFLANELEHSVVDGKVISRHEFDAVLSVQDMVDYYLPAFESCVREGKALGVMCSYNSVNGLPMCANKGLLTDVLRDKWNFDGYVTTDCGAVNDIFKHHKYQDSLVESAAAVLEAGTDIECGFQAPMEASVLDHHTAQALRLGLLNSTVVDRALQNLVRVQMRLGLWDDKSDQLYFDHTRYGLGLVDTPENQQLALEAALQSIVLLKNDGGPVLPLTRGIRLALLGPHVHAKDAFLGNYYGDRCPGRVGKELSPFTNDGTADCLRTPFEAISEANRDGDTRVGGRGGRSEAIRPGVVDDADAIVLLLGLDRSVEREEQDRGGCGLLGRQARLVEEAARFGKPTVLVLVNGGAMCLGQLQDRADAIVEAYYSGQSGADAIASVLFGSYNPSGKLPATMYPPEYMEQNPVTQMSVSDPPGRTHMYYTGQPEFPFGWGLSYSKWELGLQKADNTLNADSGFAVFNVSLVNKGPLAGRQRVLAFARPRDGPASGGPRQKLWDYQAALLEVDERADLVFGLTAGALAVSDSEGNRVTQPGLYEVAFSCGDGDELTTEVRVTGDPIVYQKSVFSKS